MIQEQKVKLKSIFLLIQNRHALAKHQERIHTVKNCCLLEQSEHGREHRGEHGERDAAAEPRLKLEAAAGGGVARRSAASRRRDCRRRATTIR